jgi:hypothetical protein
VFAEIKALVQEGEGVRAILMACSGSSAIEYGRELWVWTSRATPIAAASEMSP